MVREINRKLDEKDISGNDNAGLNFLLRQWSIWDFCIDLQRTKVL